MTDVMQDLLIDFDEMGFAPMTACPNPDKYACEWKEKLVSEINCLQEQLEAAIAGQETLQKALADKDREVERLTAEKEQLIKTFGECQAEAVRDFAERLKETELYEFIEEYFENAELCYEVRHDLFYEHIDNLVKEMVGDTE